MYTEEEKDALIEELRSMQGYDARCRSRQQTGRTVDDYADMELLYGKVLDFLLDNAVITDGGIRRTANSASESKSAACHGRV